MVQSIYQISLGYTAAATNAMVAYVLVNNTNTYTIRVYSEGLFIATVCVQGVIFDPVMLNDFKRKHVILYTQYAHPLEATSFEGFIYSSPGILMSPSNVFFGLYFFYSASNKLGYRLNLASNQIKLLKPATCPRLEINILVHLRNHCPDPYTYVEDKGECMFCMANCLRCDGGECFECGQNFTLS